MTELDSSTRLCSTCGAPRPGPRCQPCHTRAYRRAKLWANFRMTLEDFDRMAEAQGNRCALCDKAEEYRNWSIDHDHSCCPGRKSCGNCVRGLLCSRCNAGLGHFQDDPDVLEKAAAYLRRHANGVQ